MVHIKTQQEVAKRTTEYLVQFFEDTDEIESRDLFYIRGLILDELEKRNQTAFDTWLDGSGRNIGKSSREFYL